MTHKLTTIELQNLLQSNAAEALSTNAKLRLQWIVAYGSGGQSMNDVCKKFGIARSTLQRWIERFNPHDLSTLEETPADEERLHPSTAASANAVALVRQYRERDPLLGKEHIRAKLQEEHGIDLSSSTIGRIIERECLYFADTPLHWRKRMERRMQDETKYLQALQSDPTEKTLTPAECDAIRTVLRTTIGDDGNRRDVRRVRLLLSGSFLNASLRHALRTALRTVVLMSGIAFIATMILTAYWEKQSSESMHAAPAAEQTIEIRTTYSLDPSDAE